MLSIKLWNMNEDEHSTFFRSKVAFPHHHLLLFPMGFLASPDEFFGISKVVGQFPQEAAALAQQMAASSKARLSSSQVFSGC